MWPLKICQRQPSDSLANGKNSESGLNNWKQKSFDYELPGGGQDTKEIDGVRVVIMEVDGDLKQMTKMLKELTLDESKPTLAVLGSRDGGGKLMVACTEDSVAAQRYNAGEILKHIAPSYPWRRRWKANLCTRRRLLPRRIRRGFGSSKTTHRIMSAARSKLETATLKSFLKKKTTHSQAISPSLGLISSSEPNQFAM